MAKASIKNFASVVALLLATQLWSCASLPKFFDHGGDGKVTHTEAGSCVNLTPENGMHPVAACHMHDTYQVRAVDRRIEMAGAAFRGHFRERVLQFLRTTSYPWQTLTDAEVEMWLVAPIFAPESAYFMGVVKSRGGNFAVRLDLEPSRWRLESEAFQWLGNESYPSRGAKQAGLLQVSSRNGTTLVRTRAFGERAEAERLSKATVAANPLRDVRLVAAAEPEGARAAVYRFPFDER